MSDKPPQTPTCGICKRPLNQPGDPTTEDCGGDCLRCMAEAGDPDCTAGLNYRALLVKYMRHVLACEGTTFTVYNSEWPGREFTSEERLAVEEIGYKVEGEKNG